MLCSFHILRCGVYDSALYNLNKKKTDPRKVDFFELEFFLDDSGISVLNDIKYALKSGCLLFAKPGDVRYSYLHFKAYYIHFTVNDAELKKELMNFPGFFYTSGSDHVKEHFMRIIHSFYFSSVLEKFSAHAQLISVLSMVNELEVASSSNDILRKAKRYMEQHYSENITVNAIAKHCNISETHLYRIFKNTLSISPNDYLLDLRISSARKLLVSTELPVGEIAFACGFRSQCYFADCFKRKNQVSPSHFRREYKYQI